MNKTFVNTLIQNMKKADIITKASPWMVEGIGEKQMNVRYVGVKPFNDWLDIIHENNNLLIKFVIDKQSSYFELFLANKPPFIWIIRRNFRAGDKWESMLGEIKRRLNNDKAEFLQHKDKVGNLYGVIVKGLK
ncbi:MAG TPA: hypothetical protein VLG12_01685 [Candidatus Saccharimonadales bacterium]|nr:hypothetical protein [Candidatus Saccharimonadales bacterium]